MVALFHSQSGLCAFMRYELFLFYISACIALVSVFISLSITFTEGLTVCTLYSGTYMHYSTHSGLVAYW